MYIVLEYLLLENFIINYLILYLNRILLRIDEKNSRLIIGSILSSFYSLVFFTPKLIFLTMPISKVFFSIFIVRISYRYVNLKLLIKELLGFYMISFIFAGATIGMFYSFNNLRNILNTRIDIFNQFPVKFLVIGVITSIIIGKSIFQYFNLKVLRENYIADVTIIHRGNQIKFKALLDTGNSLIDPFSNRKVIVVEFDRLKHILPNQIADLITANNEYNFQYVEELLLILKDQINLTIIPFKSIGKNGMIFAFKPDSIIIDYMNRKDKREDFLVGIYAESFSKEMGYSGLLHYDLINGGMENEYSKV